MSKVTHLNDKKSPNVLFFPSRDINDIKNYVPVYKISGYGSSFKETTIKNTETGEKILPKESFSKSLYGKVEYYFQISTLHGFRYIGDTTISYGERLFWLISVLCAAGFAAYFISNIFDKYNQSPVMRNTNPVLMPISNLPFPAITICNMNQAKKSEAEKIIQNGTRIDNQLLEDICKVNSASRQNQTTIQASWNVVRQFIVKVGQSCPEMIQRCSWKQEEQNCDFIFNTALTDEGLCCTFNGLPNSIIFKSQTELLDLNITYPPEVNDWNAENGYSKNATSKGIPWKAAGAGTRLGFMVIVNADVSSYYCSSAFATGFKALLHTPLDTPKMADFAFYLSPGMETRVIITPLINDATSTLSDISVEKRKCFFTQERPLRFYRSYTQRNCELECQSNYTLGICKCVPFFLPKNKQQKVCGKKEETCITMAKTIMDSPKDTNLCNCLPGCFEIDYITSLSYAPLDERFIKSELNKNLSGNYLAKNIAVVYFYFVNTQFLRTTKSEMYGFSEFLSNTGGLLGLFMGFSFISAVELIYHLTLKVCCSLARSRRNKIKNGVEQGDRTYAFVK